MGDHDHDYHDHMTMIIMITILCSFVNVLDDLTALEVPAAWESRKEPLLKLSFNFVKVFTWVAQDDDHDDHHDHDNDLQQQMMIIMMLMMMIIMELAAP